MRTGSRMSTARRRARGVDYEQVSSDYLEHRQLRRGAAGWVLLAGLGVAYVISGDFAGWNFGLAEGGWGGLFIATVLMGLFPIEGVGPDFAVVGASVRG